MGDPQSTEAGILPTDLMRRSVIAALLYLSIAAAVMAVVCAFDGMAPLDDRVAEGGEDDPAASAITAIPPWAQAR